MGFIPPLVLAGVGAEGAENTGFWDRGVYTPLVLAGSKTREV